MILIRTIVVEFDASFLRELGLDIVLDLVEDFRVVQVMYYSPESFACVVDVKFKDPETGPVEIKKHAMIEKFQELYTYDEGKVTTAIAKLDVGVPFPETFSSFDIFLKPPLHFQKGILRAKFIGKQKAMKAIFAEFKELGLRFRVVKVDTLDFARDRNPYFSSLTTKQETILRYASDHGYFEIPRQISTKAIAKEFGITPAAVLEHLRKATKKIFETVFE